MPGVRAATRVGVPGASAVVCESLVGELQVGSGSPAGRRSATEPVLERSLLYVVDVSAPGWGSVAS